MFDDILTGRDPVFITQNSARSSMKAHKVGIHWAKAIHLQPNGRSSGGLGTASINVILGLQTSTILIVILRPPKDLAVALSLFCSLASSR